MNHSFNVDIAKKFGIEKAILLENFYFWIKKNLANKKNLHEGKAYTYNTAEAFAELFPYIKERRIAQLLREMENEDGLLISGQFHNYDRTKSYTLTDFAMSFFEVSNIQNFDNGKSENCTMENQKNVSCLNTDINSDIKTTDINTDVPAYIPKINKTNCNDILRQLHSMILDHNAKQNDRKKKIAVEKEFFYFQQKTKEGREFLELLKMKEADIILEAFENYLKVASSDSWISSFSIPAFCNKYIDYTPDYFDISKYINAPKNEEDIKAITESFAEKNMREKWFDYAVFHHHREDWIKAGKPEGDDFIKWADKVYNQDLENGIKY